ncbi:MAG: hypothetical protein AB8G22_27145, partial [Saprospiraceae bacterium]
KNDTLQYARGNGFDSPIIPVGKNRFQMITFSNLFLNFADQGNQKVMTVEVGGGETFEHLAYDSNAAWTKNLTAYAGKYYCSELDATYQFSINDNKLVASNQRLGTVEFSPLIKDSFTGNRQYFNEVKFNRKNGIDIDGFYLSVFTGDKLWFQKRPNQQAKQTKLN